MPDWSFVLLLVLGKPFGVIGAAVDYASSLGGMGVDDNPDIEDFPGYGELRAAYLWRRHTFSTLLRNNLKTSDNKGAIELAWSYPLSGVLRLYAQYYYGYGESLLDYNWKVNRFGLGISVNDYIPRENWFRYPWVIDACSLQWSRRKP